MTFPALTRWDITGQYPNSNDSVEATRVLLLNAATVMEQRGKARGTFENSRGQVCALGALRVAAGGVPSGHMWLRGAYGRAVAELQARLGLRDLLTFSDNENKQTVIDLMRTTANSLGERT